MIIFPGFQALDVFGVLDVLNLLSAFQFKLSLSLIAATLDPVSTASPIESGNPMGSNFHQSILPTHTFKTAPPLDVLIVPGGVGTRVPGNSLDELRLFIKKRYPTVKYLITICTGAALAAQAGVLDGKKATTNKSAWKWAISQGPKVNWVPVARWTVDGNVWTSSGVSAGIDAILAFVGTVYGRPAVDTIVSQIEYDRHWDSTCDPWAMYHGVGCNIGKPNRKVEEKDNGYGYGMQSLGWWTSTK